MSILDDGSDNVVAAFDASQSRLVIVAANFDAAQYINFELSEFGTRPATGSKVARWKTQIGSGDRYVQYDDTKLSGTRFWSYFETDAVQNFEVTGIRL
jgi:galactan endo-1,6-beta-galactosidase